MNQIFKELSDEGYLTGDIKIDIPNIEIISGTARGADSLGERFANEYGIKVRRFPAEWDNFKAERCIVKYNKYGKPYNILAGHNRNEDMAKYASKDKDLGVLVAFWNGKSRGTKNMIDLANRYELRVFVIQYKDEL